MSTMYSLTWDNFGNNIASKFSALQQTGQFVDMTIAAEGHYVKVHQIIMCCASPYVKELVRSIPCPHPVVFLNNISYSTLSSILQYVYTGEVTVSEEGLPFFLQAARALQIQGIGMQNVECPSGTASNVSFAASTPSVQKVKINPPSDLRTALPLNARNTKILQNISSSPTKRTKPPSVETTPIKRRMPSEPTQSITSETVLVDDNTYNVENQSTMEESQSDVNALDDSKIVKDNSSQNYKLSDVVEQDDSSISGANSLRYTVSNRGSLQLILNRYIYNLFSKSKGGQVMKWRCVDYKGRKCPACTITNGDVVIKRIALHNHTFHDKKIIDKIGKKSVYSSIRPTEQT